MNALLRRTLFFDAVLFAAASSLFAAPAMAQLSTVSSAPAMITQMVDEVALGAQVMQASDPASSQPELPGLGHKFELLGVMVRDTDPENNVGGSGASGGGVGGNETISSTIVSGQLAFAYRQTPPGIKITAFTNQLGLKYYFVAPKTCGAGSPRITLLVDANGDGQFIQGSGDFAAHGHVHPPTYAGCVMDKWIYEDLTDDLPRWEVTGATVPGIVPNVYMPWKTFAAAIAAAAPNHKVLSGFLLDGESCGFGVAANCGKAYYDLVTIENRTLEIWQDTVKK
jgi:hypothetical protein